MEDIKYIILIEFSPVVKEMQGVENDDLAVSVNNTLVYYMASLAADT